MTATITELLTQIDVPGTFATRIRAPADDLEIDVKGVGPLRFPITARTAKQLRAVARPSPFGLREQTLHDPSVRNTWEIAASRVKIAARRWKPALAKHLRALQTDLGFPDDAQLEAVFDKLLLYEKGQFFKPHQDSEKADHMVGTLVVILPSEYSGGAVTVEHRGEKKVFRRAASQATGLSLLAFYADCHHAVSPILRGVRAALTYRLTRAKRTPRSEPTRPAMRGDVLDRLTTRLRQHFATPVSRRYGRSEPLPPQRLVYLLDHEYTRRSLSWSQLKNGDQARVAALRAASERLDCECFLTLAEVHERWTCDDDEAYSWYERRRRFGRDAGGAEEDDRAHPDEHDLGSLEESTISLNHWLDAAGRHVKRMRSSAGDEELVFTKPSNDMDPFDSQYEGYQGNYGNTVDRWYHRAAFVTWPRANTFALQAQASPQWAVDQLLALPPADTRELEARVKAVLPHWVRPAIGDAGAPFFAKLLQVATRIHDPALAQRWLAPLGLHRIRNAPMRRDLEGLVARHGLPWAKDVLAGWTGRDRWGVTREWSPRLTDICADLHASEHRPCTTLARWLLDNEVKRVLQHCNARLSKRPPWLGLDSFIEESTQVAHVLAAAVAISAFEVIDETLSSFLLAKKDLPTFLLVQLLSACVARSPALADHVARSPLQRECMARLQAILNAPARAHGDWAITYPLGCSCPDCQELSRFLRSSRIAHDWPLSKERRQHIHSAIERAQLPVKHTTLRSGRPQVLQLRKERTLLSRERAYRARVKKIFDGLSVQLGLSRGRSRRAQP